MATEHPCGNLPVSGWSVHVWYCHVHQTYWASQSRYIQRDGEDVELLSVDDAQWGPFDSFTDAQDFVYHHARVLPDFGHGDDEDWVVMVLR